MMGWCWRSASWIASWNDVIRRRSMDVIHFPDDPRPARWSAAGAGARQLRRRASRPSQDSRPRPPRRRRARRDGGRDDLRSASAACRPAGQGAAAADDDRAEARGDRRGRASRARPSCASRPSCRSGIPRRSSGPCSSTGCASAKCGSAPTSCSATIAPATSRCCARSAARYGFKAEKIDPVRYKDFVVSSTRIRRLVGEGRVDEAGALLGHQYYVDGSVVHGDHRGAYDRVSDRESLHRERAAAAARRLRDDGDAWTAWCGRRSPTSASGRRSMRRGGSRSRRTSSTSTGILYGARLRIGFVQRLRDERRVRVARRAARADRGRLRSGARALRSPFTVEFRRGGPSRLLLRARVSGGASREMLSRAGGARARPGRLRRRRGRRRSATSSMPRSSSGRPRPAGRRPVQRRGGAAGDRRLVAGRRDLADLPRHCVTTRIDAPLQHPEPQRGALHARTGQHRAHVHVRPHRLRARPHRQFPHLRLRRRASPDAAPPAGLPGAAAS